MSAAKEETPKNNVRRLSRCFAASAGVEKEGPIIYIQ